MCFLVLFVGGKWFLCVSNDIINVNGGCWVRFGDFVVLEGYDEVQGRNFERNEEGFVKEEVLVDYEIQCIVDLVVSEMDEII